MTIFNLAQLAAIPLAAGKITPCVVTLRSHPCHKTSLGLLQRAVNFPGELIVFLSLVILNQPGSLFHPQFPQPILSAPAAVPLERGAPEQP